MREKARLEGGVAEAARGGPGVAHGAAEETAGKTAIWSKATELPIAKREKDEAKQKLKALIRQKCPGK